MQGFSYTQLEQALQDWAENTSAETGEFVDNIPRIVQLAELTVVRDLNLDIFDVTATTPVTALDKTVVKPVGLIALRSARLVTAGVYSRLTQRSPDWLSNYNLNSANTGTPKYIAEFSDLLWEIGPTPAVNATIESRGVYRPASIYDEETTWLGDNVGDLIFAAALKEAEYFLKADDRVEDYGKKYAMLLPTARLELRNLIRAGDYAPYRPTANKAG